MCLSVYLSVHEHISGTAGLIFTKFFVQISCRHDSVVLWRRDTLCTSSFMDDVRFGHSGPYGRCCDTGAESDVYVLVGSVPKIDSNFWANEWHLNFVTMFLTPIKFLKVVPNFIVLFLMVHGTVLGLAVAVRGI